MQVITIGLDLAKIVFQVYGVDADGTAEAGLLAAPGTGPRRWRGS